VPGPAMHKSLRAKLQMCRLSVNWGRTPVV